MAGTGVGLTCAALGTADVPVPDESPEISIRAF